MTDSMSYCLSRYSNYWTKVMKSLKRQIQRRLARREARSLTTPLRRSGALTVSRA